MESKKKKRRMRKHMHIYTAIICHLVQLMLSCCIVVSSLCIAIGSSTRLLNLLHGLDVPHHIISIETINHMNHELFIYSVVPLGGGLFCMLISSILIYQVFKHGLSIEINMIGVGMIFILSSFVFAVSLYVGLDVGSFPNDYLGLLNKHVNVFITSFHYILQNYSMHPKLQVIFEIMNCCGLYNVDDFYNQNRIEYIPSNEDEPFRITNEWILTCSNITNEEYCIAPKYCCHMSSDNGELCNVALLNKDGSIDSSGSDVYHHSCLSTMARSVYHQIMCISSFSIIISITDIAFMIRLYTWVLKNKNPTMLSSSIETSAHSISGEESNLLIR